MLVVRLLLGKLLVVRLLLIRLLVVVIDKVVSGCY
jgi:hypothetical protein